MDYCSCQPGRCAIKENNLTAVKCRDRMEWRGRQSTERPSSYVEQAPTWRRPRALVLRGIDDRAWPAIDAALAAADMAADHGDDRRSVQRRVNSMDDESFSHPWRRSRRDRRAGALAPIGGAEPGFASPPTQARTAAIRARCEAQQSSCAFPHCSGCGFDRLVDREVEMSRPADPELVGIREFEPDQAQLRAINAIYLAIGTSCNKAEDALALLTYALTEYIQKVSKPDRYPEAVETVIKCIRFNSTIASE